MINVLKNRYWVFIIIIGFLVYANSFQNQFIWDDEHIIIRNRYITSFSYLPNIFTEDQGAGAFLRNDFYRPMQLLFYSVVYVFSGLNPIGYHFLNIILHIFNGLLIYFIFSKYIGKKASLLASILYVVHPIHTEAVTYMSGTADPLSLFFALLSILAYIRFDYKKYSFYFLSIFLFILSLLSKETLIVFPLLLIVFEIYRKKFSLKRIYHYVPFFVISIVYFILRITVLNFSNTLNFYHEQNIYTANLYARIFTFLAALPTYYKLLIFPVNLHMERNMLVYVSIEPIIILSALLIAVFAYYSYKKFSVNRIWFFAFVWFFVSFIPMSGIIPVNAMILEHWLYVPSVGVFVLAGYLLSKIRKEILIPLFLIIVVIFSFLTISRNFEWKDPITFYTQTLKYSSTARVHNNLAMAYDNENLTNKAIEEYKIAINISDNYPQTHYNLANNYLKMGRVSDALKEYNRSLEIDPNFIYSHVALYNLYTQLGETEKAKKEENIIHNIVK